LPYELNPLLKKGGPGPPRALVLELFFMWSAPARYEGGRDLNAEIQPTCYTSRLDISRLGLTITSSVPTHCIPL
jgi:hypothetical protein